MPTPSRNESDASTPNDRQPTDVVDVRISRAAVLSTALVAVVCVLAGTLSVIAWTWGTATATSVRTDPLIYGSVLYLAIHLCLTLSLRLARRGINARTHHIVTQFHERPIKELLNSLFGKYGRVFQTTHLAAMVRVLAEQGRVGTTIRSGQAEAATPIDPILVAFEPRMLDAADTATLELQNSFRSTTRATTTGTQDSPALRRIKLNIRTGGGWIFLVLIAFCFVLGVIESLEAGTVTARFVLWGLVLCTLLFGGLRRRLSGRRSQWLAVPGGIIVRKAGRWGHRWGVHLFDHRRSALVVHRLTRKLSYVCVADGRSHQGGTLSSPEAIFLLQAWLSPLHPPPVEKLSDLT